MEALHMSEQSIPQDWTPDYVDSICTHTLSEHDLKAICYAHDAALAAERDRNFIAEKELRDKARARIEELKQQLAAERNETEKYRALAALRQKELIAEKKRYTELAQEIADLKRIVDEQISL
jgi:aminopeptidase N